MISFPYFFQFFFQKLFFNIFPWKKMKWMVIKMKNGVNGERLKKRWSEWWQLYRQKMKQMVREWKKDGANDEWMKRDGANGDRYIDISMISFKYGANCNRYINLSKLFIISNYCHINNINLSTVLTYPHYWIFHNMVFFNGAIDPRSCLKIGVKSTIFKLQKSLKYKSSSLINFLINRTN